MKLLRVKWNAVARVAVQLSLAVLPAAAFAATPPPVFTWGQRAGGSDLDYAAAIGADTNSNVYVANTVLSSNADFGPFTFSSGSALSKYSPEGNILWVKRILS